MFSILGSGLAQAADIAVTVGDGWHSNSWNTGVSTALSDRYTLADGSGVWIEITDGGVVGDEFLVSNNGIALGETTPSNLNGPTVLGLWEDDAWAETRYSWGTFELSPGAALLSFTVTTTAVGYATGANSIRFVSSPSRLMPKMGNALRVDSAGVTTEKNNVVSCTPGKYTFLNGGATAETAKIQSFVYTLLINGKAVSTLSSDNFKSVPSHLFPTIAGNMAGTATLDGATWDLKGMSNYSAACQVYATQSSGNVQSVTPGTHDSVALAAAAEAAAAAQKAKDMIANWATSNEELAKKYRDNRLAGKP